MIQTETKPKEHPILFATEMVQAILAGRKTQTRRIIKPQPDDSTIIERYGEWEIIPAPDSPGWWKLINGTIYKLPYIKQKYSIGDVLWVRETFRPVSRINSTTFKEVGCQFDYRADYRQTIKGHDKWKPSLFMPREACRIRLKITNIRVERASDISEVDAIAEGVEPTAKFMMEGKEIQHYFDYTPKATMSQWQSAAGSFRSLWHSINGPETWNSWVWVYEFEVIK